MNALRSIVRDLRLGTREAERTTGVSGAQLFVLQSLADRPADSVSDLAERTLTDPSSVSVVVRRLVDGGLVSSRPAATDARRVELDLTARGRRMVVRCPEPTQARLVAALARLDAAELASLTGGLEALTREMGFEGASPGMFFEEGSEAMQRRRRGAR